MSKRTYDHGELCHRTAAEKGALEADAEKLVVLPGFEVTQAKKKPITNIMMWVQCYAKYTAAMAQKFHLT